MAERFLDLHPFVPLIVADRIRGSVLGAALGDAIGLFTEFLPKHVATSAYPESSFTLGPGGTQFHGDGHRDMFEEGSWTDDTDHALLIILSFLHGNGGDISNGDFARRLSHWIHQGLRCLGKPPLGLGNTVGKIVMDPEFLGDPTVTAYTHWLRGQCRAAANGSLMRTFPLGAVCLEYSQEDTFLTAARFSSITHPDLRCVVSCCIVTAAIRGLLRGDLQSENDLDALCDISFDWVIRKWLPANERLKKLQLARAILKNKAVATVEDDPALDKEELKRHLQAKSFKDLQLDETRRIGYVYKCLGAACLSLRLVLRHQQQKDTGKDKLFQNMVTSITMEGGDADTNAAVAGALIGASVGASLLPHNWLNGLKNMSWLTNKCDALVTTLRVDEALPGYRGSLDADTSIDGGKVRLSQEEVDAREKSMVLGVLAKAEHRSKERSKATGGSMAKGWLKW